MFGVSPAVAQSPNSDFTANYLFSYLTVDNGLPNNFVDAIYKDSHGFMWICTMGGGLVKHDGYNFVHFNNRSDYQIKSNYVHSVCEDNFDRLWIATENGVNIMDLSTYGAAKSLTDSCINVNGINNTTIFKIVKDSRGSIWVTTRSSIIRFDFDSRGNVANINVLHPGTKLNSAVTGMYELDGQMLAGINNRLMKIASDDKGNLVASPFHQVHSCQRKRPLDRHRRWTFPLQLHSRKRQGILSRRPQPSFNQSKPHLRPPTDEQRNVDCWHVEGIEFL